MKSAVISQKQGEHQRTMLPPATPARSQAVSLHPVLQLQQQIGNQAVLRMLSHTKSPAQTKPTLNQPGDHYKQEASRVSGEATRLPQPSPAPPSLPIQAKLEIGTVDDPLEREADEVADKVMRMLNPAAVANPSPSDSYFRQDGRVQRAPAAPQVSRVAPLPARTGMEVPPVVHEVLRCPGQPLDLATRAFFEPRFGMDFSNVRVHVDEKAAKSAQVISAQAYTVTDHIVFGSGRYLPGKETGRALLAHELVHTVQQGAFEYAALQRTPKAAPGRQAHYPFDDTPEPEIDQPKIVAVYNFRQTIDGKTLLDTTRMQVGDLLLIEVDVENITPHALGEAVNTRTDGHLHEESREQGKKGERKTIQVGFRAASPGEGNVGVILDFGPGSTDFILSKTNVEMGKDDFSGQLQDAWGRLTLAMIATDKYLHTIGPTYRKAYGEVAAAIREANEPDHFSEFVGEFVLDLLAVESGGLAAVFVKKVVSEVVAEKVKDLVAKASKAGLGFLAKGPVLALPVERPEDWIDAYGAALDGYLLVVGTFLAELTEANNKDNPTFFRIINVVGEVEKGLTLNGQQMETMANANPPAEEELERMIWKAWLVGQYGDFKPFLMGWLYSIQGLPVRKRLLELKISHIDDFVEQALQERNKKKDAKTEQPGE